MYSHNKYTIFSYTLPVINSLYISSAGHHRDFWLPQDEPPTCLLLNSQAYLSQTKAGVCYLV